MKRVCTLLIIAVFLPVTLTTTYSQKDTKHSEHAKNLVSVDENADGTYVKFPGGNIEVNNFSDTITKITIGHKRFEVIEGYDKTRIRVVRVPREKFKGHWIGVDLGFNGYMTQGYTTSLPPDADFMDLHAGKSVSVGLNFMQYSIPFQRYRNNIGAVIGAGWTFYNYRTDNNYIIEQDDDGNTIGNPVQDITITKNKLTTSFINIPFLFEFQMPARKDHRFFISAGPYVGFLVKSHTKVVYNNNGTKVKDKNKGNLNVRPVQYGVMVRLGYRWIKLYASYNLSSLYMTGKGPELYPYSIGLTLVNF